MIEIATNIQYTQYRKKDFIEDKYSYSENRINNLQYWGDVLNLTSLLMNFQNNDFTKYWTWMTFTDQLGLFCFFFRFYQQAKFLQYYPVFAVLHIKSPCFQKSWSSMGYRMPGWKLGR